MEKGKLILVTGGAGFIGSRLCARLLKDGNRVISLDNYFAGSKDNHISGVDYREGHTKDIAMHIHEVPDIIFHLGEYSRVEQSLLEPEIVYDLNTLGTQGVIEFWRKHKMKLVYAGSSTKFGDGGRNREASPYARTKAENSELVKKIGEEEQLPYAITYFYNVYGPGERSGVYGTLIENFKQQYLRGAPLTVTLPGTQVRNFTHVDDIVDGLVLVGKKGTGDEFGLGNDTNYSILDVAKMFGTEVLLLPERRGNRMLSGLDTSKSRTLGWSATRSLKDHIAEFVSNHKPGKPLEKRILLFSTTFHPISGPAEEALLALAAVMPAVQFDVVTTAFAQSAKHAPSPLPNITVHRLGSGRPRDKYFLPLLGYLRARELHRQHTYLFAWGLMASYGALAAIFLRKRIGLPLLITLADQNFFDAPKAQQMLLSFILTGADQVYGGDSEQEVHASNLSGGKLRRHSIGNGDAFANQLRFVYSDFADKHK